MQDNTVTTQILDKIILNEITVDMNSGEFYKTTDDETLELCLTSMWENLEEWESRGIQLGVS